MSNGTRQPTFRRYGAKDLHVRYGSTSPSKNAHSVSQNVTCETGDWSGSSRCAVRHGMTGQPSPLARAHRARITVMSFADSALDVLTTPQAAALVGRHESSLKHAL